MGSVNKEDGQINMAFENDDTEPWRRSQMDVAGKVDENPVTPGQPKTPTMVYGPGESRRMMKNLIIICFAFMLLFTAFQSMASLQNSLNNKVSNPQKIYR